MTALVIKNLPAEIHHRLKDDAERHHRSMTQEAIAILERGLQRPRAVPRFEAYRGAFPLTNRFATAAKAEGRR